MAKFGSALMQEIWTALPVSFSVSVVGGHEDDGDVAIDSWRKWKVSRLD